jgi:ABC-type phosphate transport system substrate-binding protein
MKISNIIYALLMSLVMIGNASAASIVVIVHPDSPLKEASQDEIKKLFLAKSSKIQGVGLKPVAQNSSQSIRVVFDEDILGKSPSRAKAYWSRLVFTAAGMPPPELDTNAAVVKWVSENPEAIGYVEASTMDSSVKALKKF